MIITDEMLNKWKENAEKATQGRWYVESEHSRKEMLRVFGFYYVKTTEDKPGYEESDNPESARHTVVEGDNNSGRGEDFEHIANACPQNFLALIEEVTYLRELRDARCCRRANDLP